RIVPLRLRQNADGLPGTDRGKRLRFGEDFRVRPDADLEILRPVTQLDEPLLQAQCFRRTGHDLLERRAQRLLELRSQSIRTLRVAGGAILEDTLEQRTYEGDTARFDRLDVARRE